MPGELHTAKYAFLVDVIFSHVNEWPKNHTFAARRYWGVTQR